MNALRKQRRPLTAQESAALDSAIEAARYNAAALEQLKAGINVEDIQTLTSQNNVLNGTIWAFVFTTKKAGF